MPLAIESRREEKESTRQLRKRTQRQSRSSAQPPGGWCRLRSGGRLLSAFIIPRSTAGHWHTLRAA